MISAFLFLFTFELFFFYYFFFFDTGYGLQHSYEQPSPMRSTINTLEPLFPAPSVLANSAQQDEEDEVRVAVVTFARRIHFYSANLASVLQLPIQVRVPYIDLNIYIGI